MTGSIDPQRCGHGAGAEGGIRAHQGALDKGALDESVLDEREARTLVARLAEPGDPRVAAELAEFGYPGLIQRLREGRMSGAVADALRPRLERLMSPTTGGDCPRADATPRERGGAPTGPGPARCSPGDLGVPDDQEIAARLDARIVIPGDREWPTGLDDLAVPPHCLWVRGPIDLGVVTRRSVAVVGARAATAYGIDRAGEIAAGLVSRGFAVVSGAAFGIDAAAHRGALATEGTTVAVLACGIDRAYPLAHADLLRVIAASGAVVTELPPGAAPYRGRFLQRNRLIAAMSGGVVVVEAALRSGSLQTAARAIDLGRPVGAVPGPVTSASSAGCHQAIRDQVAVLVSDAAEAADLAGDFGRDAAPARRGRVTPEDALAPDQRAVWEVLPISQAATVSALALRAGLPERTVLAALGGLDLAGLAMRSGDRWRRP